MKWLFIIFLVVVFRMNLSAQDDQSVVASAGGCSAAGNISLNWTLGELIVPTFTGGSLTLSHGFQQHVIITSVEETPGMSLHVSVFPNPAGEYLMLRFEEPVEKRIVVTILDSQGKPVVNEFVEAAVTEKTISLDHLAAGVYYLRVTRGSLYNVYKVVKL